MESVHCTAGRTEVPPLDGTLFGHLLGVEARFFLPEVSGAVRWGSSGGFSAMSIFGAR